MEIIGYIPGHWSGGAQVAATAVPAETQQVHTPTPTP